MGIIMYNGQQIGVTNTSVYGDGATGTAVASNVLAGKTFSSSAGIGITGTMTNNGAVNTTLNSGDSYAIPAGYHNGSGMVTVNSLASQTDGTATASQILSGQTAYVDGSKVTGTMTNRGAYVATLTADDVVYWINQGSDLKSTIPAGYHNGSGYVYISAANLATIKSSLQSGRYTLAEETKSATITYTSEYGDETVTLTFSNQVAGVMYYSLSVSQSYLYIKNFSIQGVNLVVTLGHNHGLSNIGSSATLSLTAKTFSS